MTFPQPDERQRSYGWRIDPWYLMKVADLAAKDWARPDLETVQFVLLAHAKLSGDR